MQFKNIVGLGLIFLIGVFFLSDVYLNEAGAWCPSGDPPIPPPIPPPKTPQVQPRPIPRPPPGTGLEPLIFNPPRFGPLGSWEVWWIRNRLNYLSFKEPIIWREEREDDGTTVAVQTNKQLIEAFAQALKNDKNPSVRAMAALALGKFKHPHGLPYLKEALNDKDFNVRNTVYLSLGILGNPSSIDTIKKVLLSDDARNISRAYAALALGYIKDDVTIEALKEVLKPKQKVPKDVVCSAILSLGNLQDKSLIPFLAEILNDSKRKPQQRAYAALALGRIKNAEALPALKKALKEKHGDIRASVAIAFGLIKSPEAKDDLLNLLQKDKDLRVCQFAAISLAQLGDKSVYEPLFKIVTSKKVSYNLKGFAVIALGFLGDKKACDTLKGFVVNRQPFLKPVAIIALGLLKDKKSIPILINILEKEQFSDPISFLYAIQSLGMIGDKKAIPALEKAYQKAQGDITTANTVYNNLTVALTMLGKRKEVLETLHRHLSATGGSPPDGRAGASGGKDKSAPMSILLRALHGTAYVGDKSSIEYLLKCYKNEKNADVRMYTMFALGFVLDREEINPLYKITADNNYYIWLNILDHIFVSKPD